MATIDEELREYFVQNGTGNIMLELREKTAPLVAELEARTFSSKDERRNAVHSTLRKFTAESQKNVIAFLEKEKDEKPGITFEGLWITNKIIVRGADLDLAEKLTVIPEIEKIHAEKHFQLHKSLVKVTDAVKPQPDTTEGQQAK